MSADQKTEPLLHQGICVDAMGGDDAVELVLQGCEEALKQDPRLQIILCGTREAVVDFAARHDRVQAEICSEFITMDEHPVEALRKKKDSSIVRACTLLKQNKAAGFFSAGSTGALLAGATLIVGRIKSVHRPALTALIPLSRPLVLCDVGANADCKPEYLVQFATMAALYMQLCMQLSDPQLGLLNIGSEEGKGSLFAQQCYELLSKECKFFVGNAEGSDLFSERFDGIICDGFSGNLVLKTAEATAKFLMEEIKKQISTSPTSALGGLLVKKKLRELKKFLSADTYGGAILLGVRAPVLIGHGHTSAQAVCSGILATKRAAELKLVERITEALNTQKA